ncbi:hypothetical protein evm_011598 [Chilo suppressalis]|nr:hypothetical protein evm_011598 [Chilo suppressalis]
MHKAPFEDNDPVPSRTIAASWNNFKSNDGHQTALHRHNFTCNIGLLRCKYPRQHHRIHIRHKEKKEKHVRTCH